VGHEGEVELAGDQTGETTSWGWAASSKAEVGHVAETEVADHKDTQNSIGVEATAFFRTEGTVRRIKERRKESTKEKNSLKRGIKKKKKKKKKGDGRGKPKKKSFFPIYPTISVSWLF
jgi:hypothetical protein